MLHFQFCFHVRDYLRRADNGYWQPSDENRVQPLERVIYDNYNGVRPDGRPFYNPSVGEDGLNARQKMVNFVGNYDGLNRFRARGVSEKQNALALGLALTSEGVSCLYYGSEANLQADAPLDRDSESGRLTYCKRGDLEALERSRDGETFRMVSSIIEHRRTRAALARGDTHPLWGDSFDSSEDDGIFAFARSMVSHGSLDTSETVVVVVNAHPTRASRTGFGEHDLCLVSRDGQALLGPGHRLKSLSIAGQETDDLGNARSPREVLTRKCLNGVDAVAIDDEERKARAVTDESESELGNRKHDHRHEDGEEQFSPQGNGTTRLG